MGLTVSFFCLLVCKLHLWSVLVFCLALFNGREETDIYKSSTSSGKPIMEPTN